jgi:hypothetical protein
MDVARTSVGGTLTTKSYLSSWLPIEAGFSAGYKLRDQEKFAYFIFRFDTDVISNRSVFNYF